MRPYLLYSSAFLLFFCLSACEEKTEDPQSEEGKFRLGNVITEYAIREQHEDPREWFYVNYNKIGQPLQVFNQYGTPLEEFKYTYNASVYEVERKRYSISSDPLVSVLDERHVMSLNEKGHVEKLERFLSTGELVETREYRYDDADRITNILTFGSDINHTVVWDDYNMITRIDTYFFDVLMNTLHFEYSGQNYKPSTGWGPGFFGVLDGILPGPPYSDDFDYRFGMVNRSFELGPLNFIGKLPAQIPAKVTYEDASAAFQSTAFVHTLPLDDDQQDGYDSWYVYTLRSLSGTAFFERRFDFVYHEE